MTDDRNCTFSAGSRGRFLSSVASASALVSGLLLSEVMSNASVLDVPDDVVDSSTGNLLSDSSTDIFSGFVPESTTRSFAVATVSSLTSWGAGKGGRARDLHVNECGTEPTNGT